ncbi:hypothetical protein [Pseudomonas sp. RIT-PI-AD]|uniref:hypothetical protein n=1 Tax=Pseudomonas sp. RIT-PI-AD TaxID=3035294 RepID=UPI0021D99C6C|nr:hypothetical protein [Pseudomonas sp. RIT-PI-AD]
MLAAAGTVLTSWGVMADEPSVRDAVVAAMQKEVAIRMSAFGDRLDACRALKHRPVPRLDVATPKSFQLPREILIDAIGYLSFRNRDACDRSERLELAYALGALAALRREYVLEPDPFARDTLTQAVYPDTRRQEMKLKYERVPENARAYLERALGQEPFDLAGVLEQVDMQ